MLVKGNQLCSFLSVSLRWCKHEYQAKKTTTSTFKSKQCCKYSLRWWKQRTSSTDNRILYRRSNFLRRRGSETDRRRRWTQHERLRRRTGRRNPISDGVRSRAPSSVEIQNKAGSSFLIADTAASFACKCSQITTAEGAERKVEQRRSDVDASRNFLSILTTMLSHFNWIFTILNIVTRNFWPLYMVNRSPHSVLAYFHLFWFVFSTRCYGLSAVYHADIFKRVFLKMDDPRLIKFKMP